MFFTVFLPALLWGLCVLAALAGWGRLLALALRRDSTTQLPDWLDAPAWGIAVSSLLGGLLNLAALANRTGLVLYVLAGLALFIYSAARSGFRPLRTALSKITRADRPWLAFLLFVAALLALRFASSVIVASFHTDPGWSAYRFNPQDDMQSYLVSVERLLQTGTLGADPFNSRLMMTGLGTQHFLNALLVCVLPLDHVHLFEGGVGLAALCLATGSFGLRLGLSRAGSTVLVLIPLAVECSYINLTSNTTTAAVFTALFSCLVRPPPSSSPASRTRWLLLAGLLLGGICSLKSTAIPLAGLFLAATVLLQMALIRRVRPLVDGVLLGLIALASLIPWMLWQYHSSGTPLYPLLGQGFHWEAYFPSLPRPYSYMTYDALESGLVLPISLLLLSLITLAWRNVRQTADRDLYATALAFLLAWTLTWPILAFATENPSTDRYLAAARAIGLVVFLALAWHTGQWLVREKLWLPARFLGPGVLLAILLALGPEWSVTYFKIVPRDLTTSLQGRLHLWTIELAQARALQAAVPPGQKLLAYLNAPFLLDFQRNPVFVADWPGESSPPPGLPVHSGGPAVADYLRQHDINYIAYSYDTQASFPRAKFLNYLYFDYGHVIHRTTVNAFAFQDDLAQLARTYPHSFDDGQAFVLDLAATPRANPPVR
jgi:hypothetical protein